MALGAQPATVKAAIPRNAAAITAIGLGIGALNAAWLTRFLGGLLYETKPLDIPTFAGMSAVLFAVGLLASYVPARKAASVSPMEAMRGE
jgi:ABC-type antimicrobial peptide transport system permease subunit